MGFKTWLVADIEKCNLPGTLLALRKNKDSHGLPNPFTTQNMGTLNWNSLEIDRKPIRHYLAVRLQLLILVKGSILFHQVSRWEFCKSPREQSYQCTWPRPSECAHGPARMQGEGAAWHRWILGFCRVVAKLVDTQINQNLQASHIHSIFTFL